MKIHIIISESELSGKDSGFSLGFIEIEMEETSFSLFHKRSSMILIDIVLLLEQIDRLKKNITNSENFVGTSNGFCYIIQVQKNELSFRTNEMFFSVDVNVFVHSLKEAISLFLKKWEKINQQCFSESAYKDLKFALNTLV